ncbi:MAG: tetratricopeptide repeat protein [Candidatus Margulisiibacteriota bacterium]
MIDLAEVRKKLNEDPTDPWALRGAAQYYLKEGNYRQAQSCYAQAVNGNLRLLSETLLDYEQLIASEPEKIGARLSLVGLLLLLGQTDQATLELEELLDEFPLNVEVYNLLGRIYIKGGQIHEAIALLERSIAAGVRDVRLTETLATAYLETGRFNDAIRFYEDILDQKPNDKSTLRILGELYTRVEAYVPAALKYAAMFSDDPEVVREVIGRLEELLRRVEGNIEIRELLADIYMKTLNPEAAIVKLREVVALEPGKLGDAGQKLRGILRNYPNHPGATLALGEVLRRQGNYSEAVDNYQQLLKVKPDFAPEVMAGYRAILLERPDQVLARACLGEVLLAQNQVPEALAEYGLMISADPSVAETVIRKCREILRLQPQLIAAHIVLGKAYLAKGDYQRAAVEAEGAISIDSNLTAGYLLLGEACRKMEIMKKAEQALHTALVLDPFNPAVHEQYRQIKESEIAAEIAALRAKLQEDQWKLSLHFDLAKLYLRQRDKDGAIRELQTAQKDTTRAAAAYNLMGDIYRSDGRYDMAAAQYEHSLALAAPELARTVRFNLGTAAEAQGDLKRAIKLYEEIVQEDIDFGNLKQRIKSLKATSLAAMRNRQLIMAIAEYGRPEVVALWGRETRANGRTGGKEEVNVSFGQEHNGEGFSFFLKGMFPAAEEEFNLAGQLDRNFSSARNNLGVTLARAGRWEEARLRLAEAVQINPASAIFYNNLGVVYLLLDRLEPAQAALEKSQALDAGPAAVKINLGDLYYRQGEPQRAIELYRQAGLFDPLADLVRSRLLYKVP